MVGIKTEIFTMMFGIPYVWWQFRCLNTNFIITIECVLSCSVTNRGKNTPFLLSL